MTNIKYTMLSTVKNFKNNTLGGSRHLTGLIISKIEKFKALLRKKNIYLFLLFLPFLFSSRCALMLDPVTFKVVSQTAGFTGYYIVDNNPVSYYGDTGNVSGNFSYDQDAGELKYIDISCTAKAGATSLAIKVYRNGVKVKEATLASITGTPTLTLTYRYKEELNTTTTGP